jgi:sarcosine oxidase subunit beta
MGDDVAIIGAGVIGCAIGWELAKRGAKATVIDGNGQVGHGSTAASCGIVRRFYSTPTMTALAHEGASVWADWSGHVGIDESDELLARFERPGMLFLPPELGEGVERIVAHMREMDVPVEILTPSEVTAKFPFLDVNSHWPIRRPSDPDFLDDTNREIAGAVYEPDAGYVVSPQIATNNLHTAGVRDGVVFLLGKRVVTIDHETNGRRFALNLEDGTTHFADVLVNASGPHSSVINRMAGVKLQIETRALRREICAVENPIHARGGSLPVVGDVDSGIYFRPESGGHDIVVGSLDPKCDELEWVSEPDSCDTSCTVEGFERQVMRLMKRFPEVHLENRRGLAGMYDVTPLDWNPVLDRTDLPGYYVAIGTSGSSFKTSPVIGSVMAELIETCEAGRDHDQDPLHITLPRTGLEIDVSFFSRLRGAHATSASVLG